MKKLFYTFIILAIISSGIYSYKRGYRFGYKDGLNKKSSEVHLKDWEENHKISIDPNKPTIKIMTINFDPKYPQEILEIGPLHDVIRERYNIEYVEKDPDLLINGYFTKVSPPTDPRIIKVFYTSEVYTGDPKKFLDSYDLVIGFDFIEKPNYIRIPFQYIALKEQIKSNYDRHMKCEPKSKPYFACFLVSNGGEWLEGKFDGAAARVRMFHKLSLYKKVLSGGKYLNNIGGPAPNTQEFLSQCKFTISYENTLNYPGYVTEKPFQSWLAGSLPIYNTHPDGITDINKKSVIYAGNFQNEDEMVDYIIKVDNDDRLYCDIWNEQIINNPEKDYEFVKNNLREKLNKILDQKLKK